MYALTNCTLYTGSCVLTGYGVVIDGDKIVAISRQAELPAGIVNSFRIKQMVLAFSTPLIFATKFKLSMSSLIWPRWICSRMTSRNLLSNFI